MDFYVHLVWPQEWLLRAVISLLFVVALYVAWLCVRLRLRVAENYKILEALGSKDDIYYLENTLRMNNVDYEGAFTVFENNKGKTDANEPVFEHLKAIYDAGRRSSRLDADLLVKNTIDKICTNVDTIKSCISVFLVIGILGTLIGLGLSIGSFNGDSFIIQADANNTAKELSKLFGNLRGAFAPSMWGVFLTICFVILYTLFIQERCINKLTDKLTTSTIKVWLPALYPTDFQKGANTMAQLNDTIKNASGINESANDLLSNLDMANATVKALNDVSAALNQSVEKFNDGSDKVSVLKDSIAALSQQIEENNKNYQKFMSDAIVQVSNFQNDARQQFMEQIKAVRDNFELQNAQLQEVVRTLAIYDKNAFSKHQDLDLKLASSANDINSAVATLDDRDKKIIGTVEGALAPQIVKMTEQIKKVSEALDRIDSPLTSTAGEIQKMFGNMLTSMEHTQADMLQAITKGGISAEDIEKMMRNKVASSNFPDNGGMEQKLQDILECLQQNSVNNAGSNLPIATVTKDDEGTVGVVKKYMPIAIGILLAISIAVQCVMVSKIGALEQSQNNVNQVLLKGDKVR
ncbi:MAG: MotA/TolQ/ExbB proton channel family protein [Phascolarctobacterium sp.]|uniref:MotA/TolQ/ExbB proton channel family protein n=1 Tax=Phascolarctobacterium sp. TaxID=2049039 RepID=UPI0026DD75A6|nr:MotA/TolQ/ExbB proton channel family protein [Phascolarctobacterium sp.]MDO4921883.1 MotA/TolQ/ExbB proton channel family protein [Phascolarctobacterium sp.]